MLLFCKSIYDLPGSTLYITFPVYTCGHLQSHPWTGAAPSSTPDFVKQQGKKHLSAAIISTPSTVKASRSCKTLIWKHQDIVTRFQNSSCTYSFMEFITKREPCSPPFTCTCYKNKLLNNRWLAANSKRLQHWPLHPPGDDLPWFTSISWSESANSHHWQLLHCPELNLPLGIRISVWLETLKVGYNQCFRASSLRAP